MGRGGHELLAHLAYLELKRILIRKDGYVLLLKCCRGLSWFVSMAGSIFEMMVTI